MGQRGRKWLLSQNSPSSENIFQEWKLTKGILRWIKSKRINEHYKTKPSSSSRGGWCRREADFSGMMKKRQERSMSFPRVFMYGPWRQIYNFEGIYTHMQKEYVWQVYRKGQWRGEGVCVAAGQLRVECEDQVCGLWSLGKSLRTKDRIKNSKTEHKAKDRLKWNTKRYSNNPKGKKKDWS